MKLISRPNSLFKIGYKMTLFNLVNKGRAFSLIEDKNKTYVLKKMLWSNELIYEEIESSFCSGIQKDRNSFPVTIS